MATVSIRELGQNASGVIADVSKNGRPIVVTKHGAPVAAVIAINNDDLEDLVLSKAPQFLADFEAADDDVRKGKTVNAGDFFDQLDLESS